MLEHIITTIYIGFQFLYSYFVNVLIYRDETRHYKYFINVLTETNMLFIKFMQWFSSNDMNDELKTLIRSFANNVPYTSDDIEYDQIKELIASAENKNMTLEINMVPVNAGTIAIVYDGTLNNKPVILKQMRKNVKQDVESSIELMKFIATLSSYIPYMKSFRLDEIIKFNESSILEQLDFKKEIENGKIFKEAFSTNDNVIIPIIYDNITEHNKNVILMEKLIGYETQDIPKEELHEYCISYNNLLIESLITRGVVHGDLHIGNIFFMENYKIGLIDFGHILLIDKDLSKNISMFYKFLFNRQLKKLGKFIFEHVITYHNEDRKNDVNTKEKVIASVINSFNNNALLSGKKPINIYFILEINDILTNVNAQIDAKFMNVLLSLGPMSSVVSILKRDDSHNSLRGVFLDYVHKKIPTKLQNYDE